MKTKKNKTLRILRNILLIIVLMLAVLIVVFKSTTNIKEPVIEDLSILDVKRENPSKDFYKINSSWLKKNKYGLWEMYLEGKPFEIGVINGKLTKELIKQQEDSFVDQINNMIPSKFYLRFLKYFVLWFNRDIDNYIPQEYIDEIYGVSFSAADGYEFIGTKYERMLNYHGAHDIGHALQSLALVGCTSFAANLGLSDSSLILGRNFDFYINEEFAENKIVAFVKPDKGHKFAYVTWASMIGVVSGINDQGLTVTINAAKSDIPTKAKMPISLLAREILQYAGSIDEAIEIAEKRETFVSESLLIGSANDNNAAIIEKSPTKIDVYFPNENLFVCSNHFQSNSFKNEENNIAYIKESASKYRQDRCEQLLYESDSIDYLTAAAILRDDEGIDNDNIGIGNEKSMAQYISHHSIIFMPMLRDFWVSTFPYQFGEYLMYNMDHVFSIANNMSPSTVIYDTTKTIPEDGLALQSINLLDTFRLMRDEIKQYIGEEKKIDNESVFIQKFIDSNPNYYQVYLLIGNYFYTIGETYNADQYYKKSLNFEFENTTTREMVEARIAEIDKKNK
jgi:isopenicillin-N N-acyltransferase-like protein